MRNNRIHYFLIPILIILIIWIYFKKNDNQYVSYYNTENNIETDTLIQVGNCFYYKDSNYYYGVIFVQCDYAISEFSVAPLNNRFTAKPNIDDFKNGSIIYQKYSDLIVPNGAQGLWTGFLFRNDFNLFKQEFRYVGKIEIDESRINISGGGQLLDSIKVSIKSLIDSPYPESIIRTIKPVREFIKE